MLPEKVCVVAALLNDNELRTNLHELTSHVVVLEWTEARASELIMNPAIEAATYQDQIRLELTSDWEQKRITGMLVLVTAKLSLLFSFLDLLLALSFLECRFRDYPGLPGHVNIETSTITVPNVRSLAIQASREESHVVITV